MSPQRILIVDDSPTIRKMVAAALRPLHADLDEAGNGLEAIERLTLNTFDAMTLDLNMPDMHGLEVIQFVRRTPLLHTVRIVVLTTRCDQDSRQAILAAGADVYLTKPFTAATLLSVLKELLPQ